MNREEFIAGLFARAKEQGFQDCEVYYARGNEFSCKVLKGEVVSYSSADSMGLGFRGIYGGKMGYASTQVLDEDAIDLLVLGAKTNAELIESEDEQFIFEGSETYTPVDTFNPALEEISAAKKLELCRELEKKTLSVSDKVTRVKGCEIVSEMSEIAIVNTRGLNVCGKGNLLGAVTTPLAQDGSKVNTGFKYAFVQNEGELDLNELARSAAAEAVDGLYAKSAPSGNTSVCIRGNAMASLLSTFSDIFSAEAAQKGLSLLKGCEGETVAAQCVTIMDDPHMPYMASSASFDGEGVATSVKAVVDNGRLTTLLHNLKTAQKQGVQTTGNAFRASYAGSVGVAPTNFYIKPAEKSMTALLEEMGEGLLITGLQGLHSGANPISGDFSLSAKGYFVKNGKQADALNDITIAGNFYSMLKLITDVANDLVFSAPGGSTFGSPTVRISELAIAGTAK